MSTGKDTEWTVHTSRRSRRPAATVTPRKPEPSTPEPIRKPEPSKPTPKAQPIRKPAPQTIPTQPIRKPEPSKPTPKAQPIRNSEPSKPSEPEPSKPKPDIDTASITSVDSDDSMTEEDRYRHEKVKDFVPPSQLVPITNQVTSDDVSTFRQVIADGLARMSSRYTDKVALTGGYAFLV
eukprot:CAMPEP_0168310134 /NCGR_PEP_ID=MMETSP0142_2-20121227/66660_1 /TAXON_ID=44445 /ORGANISM="Pseudo-nitzschia australis, Strain 10249 10 AB" /LENGTH=178 /DNA_ID=CAMNT_0008262923 /DNA_START=467 /DNA_END=999 /DNA_ORIENTATION=+